MNDARDHAPSCPSEEEDGNEDQNHTNQTRAKETTPRVRRQAVLTSIGCRNDNHARRKTNDSLTCRLVVRHVHGIDGTRRQPRRRKTRHARASDARRTRDVHACAEDEDANTTHTNRTNPCRRYVQLEDACHDRTKTRERNAKDVHVLRDDVQWTSQLTREMRNWPRKACPRCRIARLVKADTNGWTYGTCCIEKGSSSWDKTSTKSSGTKS